MIFTPVVCLIDFKHVVLIFLSLFSSFVFQGRITEYRYNYLCDWRWSYQCMTGSEAVSFTYIFIIMKNNGALASVNRKTFLFQACVMHNMTKATNAAHENSYYTDVVGIWRLFSGGFYCIILVWHWITASNAPKTKPLKRLKQ